jgi:hypothetical protein
MKIKTVILLIIIVMTASFTTVFALVDNSMVRGYKKPDVCLRTNIRCILKKQGDTMYWCLKSNLQRTLDARRTTSPIKKTKREILGHCAKIIPIRE